MFKLVACPIFFRVVLVLQITILSAAIGSGQKPKASAKPKTDVKKDGPAIFEVDERIRAVLFPLFEMISKAEVSRTTVELASETIVAGQIVDTKEAVYQIASREPNEFTIYFKEPEQRTRIYNGKAGMTIALAPDAYVKVDDPMTIADAVDDLPIPMGTFPEPVLALSLAGFDPAINFIGGMKSLTLVDQAPFRGKTPSTHIRGVQDDRVTWDLWLADEETPRPLRLIVDITQMLRASRQMRVPPGYQYQLRYDFLSWRMWGEVQDSLFAYTAPKGARQYDSVNQYTDSIAGVVDDHPLLGKPMPRFAAVAMDGSAIASQDWKNKVVVLDFWSTWCGPCLAAMPTLERVMSDYDDVVFYAVNVGEGPQKVRGFCGEQSWDVPVLLDPKAEIAGAFQADAIPQRMLIGKSGLIESVHVGFRSNDALAKQLTDELDVLTVGGRIASGTKK